MTRNRASDRVGRPQPRRRDRALEQAIAQDVIAIRFQPQVDPASGEVVAVEALSRWDDEPCGEGLFARARTARLGERLSRHAQRRAIVMAACWGGNLAALGLSINVAAEDLARDGYGEWLAGVIADSGLAPERLTLEITESSLVGDLALVAERLERLRCLGIKVAIDDFGTGYANMAYLSALPLDALKLDRSLVAAMAEERGRIVVRALIGLARDLDLKSVVEGVETLAQWHLVAAMGCDLIQGFLAAGALDEAELARFVAASMRSAA